MSNPCETCQWKPEGFPIDERGTKRQLQRCTECGATRIEVTREEQ